MTSLYETSIGNTRGTPPVRLRSPFAPTSLKVSPPLPSSNQTVAEKDTMDEEGDLLSILEEEENEIRLLQQRLQERKAKLQSLKKNLRAPEVKFEPLVEATKKAEVKPTQVENMVPRIEITVPSSPEPHHDLSRPSLEGARKPSIDWATQVEDYEQEQRAIRSALKGFDAQSSTGTVPAPLVSTSWQTVPEKTSIVKGVLQTTKESEASTLANTNVSFLTEHIFPDGGPRRPNNQRDWNPAEIIYGEWKSGERKDKKRQEILVYRVEATIGLMKEKDLSKLKFQMPTTEFKELALNNIKAILPADLLSTATEAKIRTVLQPMVDWLNYYAAYARTVIGIKRNDKDQNDRYRNFGKTKPGQPSWKTRAENIAAELADAIRFNEELCAFIYVLKEIADTKKGTKRPTSEGFKDNITSTKDSAKEKPKPEKQDSPTSKKNKGKQVGKAQTPVKPRIILKNPNSPQEIDKAKAVSEVLQVISQNAEPNGQQDSEEATDFPAQQPSTPQSTTDSVRKKLTKSQKAKAKKLANATITNGDAGTTNVNREIQETFAKSKKGKKQGGGNTNSGSNTPKQYRAPLVPRDSFLQTERRRQIDKAQLERLQSILRTEEPAVERNPCKEMEPKTVSQALIVCDGNVDSPLETQTPLKNQDGETTPAAKGIESSHRRSSIELKPSYGPWAEKNSWRSRIPDKPFNVAQLATIAAPTCPTSLDPSAKPFTFEPQSCSLPTVTATREAQPPAPAEVSLGPNLQPPYHTASRSFVPRTSKSFTSLKGKDLRTRKPIIFERNRLKNDLTQTESILSAKIVHICGNPHPDDPEWYEALDIDTSIYEEATWSLQRKVIQTLERLDMLASERLNLAEPLLKQSNPGKIREQLGAELASLKQVVQDAQGDIATKKTFWITAKDEVEKFKKSEDKIQKNAVLREYMWRKEDWIEAARYWSGTLGPLLRGRIEYCEGRLRDAIW